MYIMCTSLYNILTKNKRKKIKSEVKVRYMMTIDTIKQLYFISNFYTVYDDEDFRSSASFFFF